MGLQRQSFPLRLQRAERPRDRRRCTPGREGGGHLWRTSRITKLIMTTMITIITMADLNKSIVQLHLGPAVRPCGVRGVGRHHAGDQRHLDMHSGQGDEGVSHQVYLN